MLHNAVVISHSEWDSSYSLDGKRRHTVAGVFWSRAKTSRIPTQVEVKQRSEVVRIERECIKREDLDIREIGRNPPN